MPDKSESSIDWRGLFDHLRVPWRDQGPNTSQGNINIPCPFCGDDPSYHMSVAEYREAYYCYRNPSTHSGRSARRLLKQLGVAYQESLNLINSYNRPDRQRHQRVEAKPLELSAIAKDWSKFLPARQSDAVMGYLHLRGFPDPELVADNFDLRYAPRGEWAQRLLIPFDDENGLVSWTGRAISKKFETPRYKNHITGITGILYAPRLPRNIAVTVEGPLDALKVNAALEGTGHAAIALTGLALNENRLYRYTRLLRYAQRHLICLDADAPMNIYLRIANELAPLMPAGYTKRLRLPVGEKDPGGMDLDRIREWVTQ